MTQEQSDPDKLRADIAETREELGETVGALSEKADVKAQAKAKVDEAQTLAREQRVPIAAGGLVLLLIVLWLVRRD
jgi:hypothetical protein